MSFSDFIVYVDESGDHSLTSVDADYPIFVLSCCIFEKSTYARTIVPELLDLKFRYFGHDMVVLHSHEIRKAKGIFRILVDSQIRQSFLADLNDLVESASFTLISGVIDKRRLSVKYVYPANPYKLALLFCLERTYAFLRNMGQQRTTTHVIVEARGQKEDRELELEFRRICDGQNRWGRLPFTVTFAHKMTNSAGLQLADLVGQPVGRHYLRPNQANRAYDILEPKFRKSGAGKVAGWGYKTFP